MGLIPWWIKAIGIAALFGGAWLGVHKIEEHYRDQGRTEIREQAKKDADAAKAQVADLQSKREASAAESVKLSQELEGLKQKEARNEESYRKNVDDALRRFGGVPKQSSSAPGNLPTADEVGALADFASKAVAASERYYRDSIDNADQVDRILAAIETDRAAFYASRGEKDPDPSKAAQERVAKRLAELRSLGEDVLTQ